MAEDIKTKLEGYRTAPFDARFPNQNQTRNCWSNYLGKAACQGQSSQLRSAHMSNFSDLIWFYHMISDPSHFTQISFHKRFLTTAKCLWLVSELGGMPTMLHLFHLLHFLRKGCKETCSSGDQPFMMSQRVHLHRGTGSHSVVGAAERSVLSHAQSTKIKFSGPNILHTT